MKDTDLASFDESASHWVVESGKYEAQIGSSADDIRLRDSFNVKGRVTEKVHAVLFARREDRSSGKDKPGGIYLVIGRAGYQPRPLLI